MADAVDLDRPDPEDLGTAGDWLKGQAVSLIIRYDPTTDTVRVDRGTTPKTIALAVLRKAEAEDLLPATWGEPVPEDEDDPG